MTGPSGPVTPGPEARIIPLRPAVSRASGARRAELRDAVGQVVGHLVRSFAGRVAALIMTGTLYGAATFHWAFGFFFGAGLGALTLVFLVGRPTVDEMERAVRASAKEPEQARPAVA